MVHSLIITRIRHARWACYSISCGELVAFGHLPSASLRSDGGLRPPAKCQKFEIFEIFKILKFFEILEVFEVFDFFYIFENFAVLKFLIFLKIFFWNFSIFFSERCQNFQNNKIFQILIPPQTNKWELGEKTWRRSARFRNSQTFWTFFWFFWFLIFFFGILFFCGGA